MRPSSFGRNEIVLFDLYCLKLSLEFLLDLGCFSESYCKRLEYFVLGFVKKKGEKKSKI